MPASSPPLPEPAAVAVVPFEQAREWAGRNVTVAGTLAYVVNNGKHVLLAFSRPHQGTFKVLIRRADWSRFSGHPEKLFQAGQRVEVSGLVQWYQGDPVIFVTSPDAIRISPVLGQPQAQGQR